VIERAVVVPHESSIGVPYNIVPPADRVLVKGDPGVTTHHSNFSHLEGFFNTWGEFGQEVRASRIELVEATFHNQDFYVRPLPTDRQISHHPLFTYSKVSHSPIGQARLILGGGLRAVTPEVLDYYNGEIRPITDEERKRLFESGEVGVQSMEMVVRALVQYSLRFGSELATGDAKKILMLSDSDAMRAFIDEEVLPELVAEAFQPIEGRFKVGLRRKMFRPGTPETAHEAALMLILSHTVRFKAVRDHALSIVREMKRVASSHV